MDRPLTSVDNWNVPVYYESAHKSAQNQWVSESGKIALVGIYGALDMIARVLSKTHAEQKSLVPTRPRHTLT